MCNFSSNSLIELAEQLNKNTLSKREDCFKDINIVVPDNSVAQWLKAYLLKNTNNVLMGINFLTLEDALIKFIKINGQKFIRLKRNQLRTILLKKLLDCKNDVVKGYIKDNDGNIIQNNLYDFANVLSELFFDYEKNDAEIEKDWAKDLYDYSMKELYDKGVSTFSYLSKIKKEEMSLANDYKGKLILFGFNTFDKCYEKILNDLREKNILNEYILKKTNVIKLDCLLDAPSKMREIEAVHSKICNIIKDNNDVLFSDILILAPNIGEYEREIIKVFNQDGKNFPYIPYNINGVKEFNSDVSVALKKLLEIANKGFFTRLDFDELINNKIVQSARGFDKQIIDSFQQSIIKTNTYQNGINIDDWEWLKKRLILSKVANVNSIDDNVVKLKEGEFLPFSIINLDDEDIIKFISAIDDLNQWIDLFKNDKTANVNNDSIDIIKQQLKKWFSYESEFGTEQNDIYIKMMQEIIFWEEFDMTNNTIPLRILMQTLIELSIKFEFKSVGMFTSGVTFADYNESAILYAKYLFILGVSSNNFPKIKQNIEIDDLEFFNVLPSEQLNCFKLQCYNAENTYLSYVNRDLATDEEFFPSSFVNEMCKSLDGIKKSIEIDETRSWSELFTRKEHEEKKYYNGLFGTSATSLIAPKVVKKTERDPLITVSSSKIKSFLIEPLKYKFESIFGEEDDTQELLKNQYSPFNLDNLSSSIIVNGIVSDVLISNTTKYATPTGSDISKRLLLEHKFPYITKDIANNCINQTLIKVTNNIKEIEKIVTDRKDLNIVGPIEYSFTYNNSDVKIIANKKFGLSILNKTRKYIDFNIKNKKEYSNFINIYVLSLIDVANLGSNEEYEIELYLCEKRKVMYKIKRDDARDLIKKIYEKMNDYESNAYMPIDIAKSDKDLTINKLLESINDDNFAWKYFKNKKMFRTNKDIGYPEDEKEAKNKINEMKSMLNDLVIFEVEKSKKAKK